MQLGGKLTEADLTDVGDMTRSKMYWVKLLFGNLRGFLLLAILVWAAISGLLGRTKPDWRAVGVIWLVIASIVLFAIYRTKRDRQQELTQLNATLPDQLELTSDGIRWNGPNGSTGFLPWTAFKGWREGRRVVLVDQTQGNRFLMLPVGQLSEIQREPIRQFLRSHIPSVIQ